MRAHRRVAMLGLVAALAVSAHGSLESAAHDHADHGAVVVCLLLFTAVAALAPGPPAGAARSRPPGATDATAAAAPCAAPATSRCTPVWLQRFLR